MKIGYQRDGGLVFLPGLQRVTEIEVQALDGPRCEAVMRLVGESCFFDLPAQVGERAAGAADHVTDILTVESDGRRHQVRIVGTPTDQALAALLTIVRDEAAARRRGSAS